MDRYAVQDSSRLSLIPLALNALSFREILFTRGTVETAHVSCQEERYLYREKKNRPLISGRHETIPPTLLLLKTSSQSRLLPLVFLPSVNFFSHFIKKENHQNGLGEYDEVGLSSQHFRPPPFLLSFTPPSFPVLFLILNLFPLFSPLLVPLLSFPFPSHSNRLNTTTSSSLL